MQTGKTRKESKGSAAEIPSPQGKPGKREEPVEIVEFRSGYVRRQKPQVSEDLEQSRQKRLERVERLDAELQDLAGKVMTIARSNKDGHEEALEKVRSLLNQIIQADPSRYETPLGSRLESAIIKIYSVIGVGQGGKSAGKG